jgi:mono/diheme cytochrome c family protein
MIRKAFSLVLAAALLPSVAAAAAKGRIALKSLDLNLPTNDQMFPPGPGADAANGNCLACHSVEMVLTQPPLPKAAWEAEVAKMRNVYKAPVDPKDDPAIVDYLVSIKGK